jgi:hypothetical protein
MQAPRVRSSATLAAEGWRLEHYENELGEPRYRWLCPTCIEQTTGVAPLRRAH